MAVMSREDVLHNISRYRWYHSIQVTDDVWTESKHPSRPLWNHILTEMRKINFQGARVLDVGCRDGLFSFEAEKLGAREILAIDNDMSEGTSQFLIPYFNSKVQMRELNLYDVCPGKMGLFDVICFFGVLYHLRYPFSGLKKLVDCLPDKGLLLLEGGMLIDPRLENLEVLYCPFEKSPYEMTSCTFFNKAGLCATMRTFGCNLLDCRTLMKPGKKITPVSLFRRWKKKLEQFAGLAPKEPEVEAIDYSTLLFGRQFFVFQKDAAKVSENNWVQPYWEGVHNYHTRLDLPDQVPGR